jgi:hypothetical protein
LPRCGGVGHLGVGQIGVNQLWLGQLPGANVAERGDIVAQRVKPYVDHLAGITGNRDAPAACPFGGPRYREVLQAAVDEPEHLVTAPAGLDAQLAAGDGRTKRLAVAGQPEEPVLLGHALRLGVVVGAASGPQFGGGVELLTTGAVQPLVLLAVQIPGRGARLPAPLDARAVPCVPTGPDDVVDGERQGGAQREERLRVAVDELPYALARRLCREHVLQRVVVGAGLEPDVVPVLAPEAGQHIGLHDLERETDMRAGVHVRDGGGDVSMRRSHGNLQGLRPP